MTPNERQALRADLLVRLYEVVDGKRLGSALPTDFAPAGVDAGEVREAMSWLSDNGLAETSTLAGDYELTPHGINEAERLISERAVGEPEDPVAGDGLHLVVLSADAVAAIEALLSEIDRADIPAKLEGDNRASFEADRASVSTQMRSPTPRRRPVRDGIRNMLTAVRSLGVEISSTVILKALKMD